MVANLVRVLYCPWSFCNITDWFSTHNWVFLVDLWVVWLICGWFVGNLADLLVFTPGFWVVCWFFCWFAEGLSGLRVICGWFGWFVGSLRLVWVVYGWVVGGLDGLRVVWKVCGWFLVLQVTAHPHQIMLLFTGTFFPSFDHYFYQ